MKTELLKRLSLCFLMVGMCYFILNLSDLEIIGIGIFTVTRAAAIAPWFGLSLASFGRGFESQAHQLLFFNLHC